MKIAVIDIGSNSVRLMLWADGKTLFKKIATTRLGAGLAASGHLSGDAIARSVAAVCEFQREAFSAGYEVLAFATAAVRSANNGAEFCAQVKEACGLSVDVISGESEALLGLYGALGEGDGGIVDIGGASTEVCFRRNGHVVFSQSIGLGAVRLYDLCKDDRKELDRVIGGALGALDRVRAYGTLYAIGGTASTLASIRRGLCEYDAERLRNTPLSVEWAEEMAGKLLDMPSADRAKLKGMEAGRADIIAGGAYLFFHILKKLSTRKALFSDGDNLEGYLAYKGIQ